VNVWTTSLSWGEARLRRILKSYTRYYNKTRMHLALDEDAPVSRPVERAGVVWSGHLPSWADFTTTTLGVRFLVHTSKARTFAQEFGALF
jgi:hypothetical protein